ncbi:MAG: diaminopimelate decarboxylase, partial [Peptostreptococcaceae bacterium]|nr:diaminopimelate decarboxylase [Peptostreptococcaceae bacterium]
DIAKRYGTPLYVYSYKDIKNQIQTLKEQFENKYENVRIAYASKAFNCVAICQIMQHLGVCLDIVSEGELYTAKKAGFDMKNIEINGNNKLISELEDAIEYGVGRIIVDGLSELDIIEDICKRKNKRTKILFRITPGVDSHTNEKISTGKLDSKFGIPIDEDVLYPQIEKAINSEYVDFLGFHFHVGSQLFDNISHLLATDIILDIVKNVKEKYNYDIKELNLGGGFGATYTNEQRKPYSYFLDPMMKKIEAFCKKINIDRPAIVIEPGRSIIAEAGIQLYSVGQIKDIKDVRKYVSVDGGMSDNIRPSLYDAKYDAIIANRADENADDLVTICGKCCESGDILIKDIMLPTPKRDDIIAVFTTGAYGYSMASNYNKLPKPAVVMIKDGKVFEIIKRQSYEDMIKNELSIEL